MDKTEEKLDKNFWSAVAMFMNMGFAILLTIIGTGLMIVTYVGWQSAVDSSHQPNSVQTAMGFGVMTFVVAGVYFWAAVSECLGLMTASVTASDMEEEIGQEESESVTARD